MNCDEMKDLLPLYCGGEVADNERIAVDSHLSMCPECAKELHEYREARGLLASVRESDVPTDMWKNVRNRLFPGKRAGVLAFDWALRAAAVLVIGLAIGFIASSVGRRGAPAPSIDMAPEAKKTTTAPGPSGDNFTSPSANEGRATDYAGSNGGREFRMNLGPREGFYLRPALRPDGNFYLPRVDQVLGHGEKDF